MNVTVTLFRISRVFHHTHTELSPLTLVTCHLSLVTNTQIHNIPTRRTAVLDRSRHSVREYGIQGSRCLRRNSTYLSELSKKDLLVKHTRYCGTAYCMCQKSKMNFRNAPISNAHVLRELQLYTRASSPSKHNR